MRPAFNIDFEDRERVEHYGEGLGVNYVGDKIIFGYI